MAVHPLPARPRRHHSLAAHPAITSTDYKTKAVYYVTDHQGSVIMLINAHGNRVAAYRYTPYGDPLTLDNINNAADNNPWRYLGAYYTNQAGGYHHLGARYYDNHAHFTQPDPNPGNLTNPLTTMAYGYAGCDPINRMDRRGRSWDDAGEFLGLLLTCADSGLQTMGYAAPFTTIAAAVGRIETAAGIASLSFLGGCASGMILAASGDNPWDALPDADGLF